MPGSNGAGTEQPLNRYAEGAFDVALYLFVVYGKKDPGVEKDAIVAGVIQLEAVF